MSDAATASEWVEVVVRVPVEEPLHPKLVADDVHQALVRAGYSGLEVIWIVAQDAATPALTPAQIDAMRVAKGVCRHCGGPVPCHSEFGDQRVGVRHSRRSWKAMRKREDDARGH